MQSREKNQQRQPVKIQGPFNLLASIKKGSALPMGIAQTPTVHKWCANISGVTDQMDVIEGPTKPSELDSCDSRHDSFKTAI